MSLAKVNVVSKSRKPGTCEKCGTDLPVGSEYRWFTVGFRSHHKRVRCMQPECAPKDSERESSLLAEVYAARENAEEQIANATDAEEMQSIIEEYAEAVREVASQYEEAMTDDQGNVFNTTAEERYEALTQAADEIESAASDVEDATKDCETCDAEGTIECEACGGSGLPDGNEDQPEDSDEQCDQCDGEGKVDCPEDDCTDGQVPDLDAMREAAQEALDTDLGC